MHASGGHLTMQKERLQVRFECQGPRVRARSLQLGHKIINPLAQILDEIPAALRAMVLDNIGSNANLPLLQVRAEILI